MKIWTNYSSEHSSRIVLVGHFKSEPDARTFLGEYQKVIDLAMRHYDECQQSPDAFPDAILDLLFKGEIKFTQVMAPRDLLEFGMELEPRVKGKDFVLTSSEYDWGGTLKMLLMAGAKVEFFSGHDYKEDYEKYTGE